MNQAPRSTVTHPGQAALAAGVGLLVMVVLAVPANFVGIETVRVPGNAVATAGNIVDSASVLRLSAVALLLVAVLDVIVAWALYELFRIVHSGLSLLSAWFRLAYAAVFALGINFLFTAGRLAGTDPTAAFNAVEAFDSAWMIGQVLFGFHLILLGVLALRSGFAHWLFGVLLLISGIGYLFDGLAVLLNPDFGFELSLFTFFGEVVFIFWLLIRGTRLPNG